MRTHPRAVSAEEIDVAQEVKRAHLYARCRTERPDLSLSPSSPFFLLLFSRHPPRGNNHRPNTHIRIFSHDQSLPLTWRLNLLEFPHCHKRPNRQPSSTDNRQTPQLSTALHGHQADQSQSIHAGSLCVGQALCAGLPSPLPHLPPFLFTNIQQKHPHTATPRIFLPATCQAQGRGWTRGDPHQGWRGPRVTPQSGGLPPYRRHGRGPGLGNRQVFPGQVVVESREGALQTAGSWTQRHHLDGWLLA